MLTLGLSRCSILVLTACWPPSLQPAWSNHCCTLYQQSSPHQWMLSTALARFPLGQTSNNSVLVLLYSFKYLSLNFSFHCVGPFPPAFLGAWVVFFSPNKRSSRRAWNINKIECTIELLMRLISIVENNRYSTLQCYASILTEFATQTGTPDSYHEITSLSNALLDTTKNAVWWDRILVICNRGFPDRCTMQQFETGFSILLTAILMSIKLCGISSSRCAWWQPRYTTSYQVAVFNIAVI